jgi:iron complex outermembrane receptor protein
MVTHSMKRRGTTAGAMATLLAGLVAPVAVVHAAAPMPMREPACTVQIATQDRASLWSPPLDRIVSAKLPELPVRDALERLASIAKVELSYSAELLPQGRRVCLSFDHVPVGAVLESLLSGSTLRAVVLGTSQVVLAPTRTPVIAEAVPMTRRASVLDRVVVTGSPDGAPQRGSPFALDVIEGATLAQHGVSTLGEALDLAVPGVWTWTATAGTVTARYGSIRGASSFGVSAPKIYLDGIEVANPLLVTQLDPARIARVEVIRGPQGAALYGADAISGVVNILTRHDGTPSGAPQLQLSTSAGVSATSFAPRSAFVQDHAVAFRVGTPARSMGLGLNVGTVGAYVPGASERRLLADGDVRVARANAVITGTARFSLQRANASTGLLVDNATTGGYAVSGEGLQGVGPSRRELWSPSMVDSMRPRDTDSSHVVPGDSAAGQDVAQYTVGGSLAVMPTLNWTHTIIAGVDGYRLRGLTAAALPAPSSGLSNASLDGEGAADRVSFRMRSVGRFDVADATLFTLTIALEQAFARDVSTNSGGTGTMPPGATGGPGSLPPQYGTTRVRSWADNSGASVQGMLSWRERWYASAGVRGEVMTGTTPVAQRSVLPMLGAAYVREYGNTVFKLRGAYGTGIRPARTLQRSNSYVGRAQLAALASLQPESQSGTEFGADLLMGSRVAVHLTRFDQRASGLIQPVSSVVTTVNNGRLVRAMSYTLQNVGAITNRGWELEATTRVRQLSLAGTLSLVDSRVARVATGYRGELRVGDRMLDVPASTLSLSAAYTTGRWTLASTASRAADWIGYDRTRVGEMLANDDAPPKEMEGAMLRRYWITYGGVTRWRASVSYRVRGDLSAVAGGDNLLNVQRGAPDNSSVLAGRTLTFGLRTTF